MKHEKQLTLQFHDDPFAQAVQGRDDSALDRRQRWFDGPEQEGTGEAHTRYAMSDDARVQSVDVQQDIRKLRHRASSYRLVP